MRVTPLIALVVLAAPAAEAAPRRIVSLNLCTDQLLIALADRDQIAGVTRLAVDPAMSAAAPRARGLHALRDANEEVVALAPDLVVGVSPARAATLGRLTGRPLASADLSYAQTIAGTENDIRAMAALVGHPGRGRAMVARMEAALARLPRDGAGRTAAYYQRRGYLTGTGTLVDALMTRVGLVNLARRLGAPALTQLPIETLVAAKPDFLIVEGGTDRVADAGSAMLHHPALASIPRLRLPAAWTVCGGPAIVAAARSLARQLAEPPAHQKRTRTPP